MLARRFDRVRLLDRDRWGTGAEAVPEWVVDPIEELSHGWAERLAVPALAFGVNGFERQPRFATAARAGNNRQIAERKIDIDSFEIVLASTANFNALRRAGRGTTLLFNNLRTHWRRFQMRGWCANFCSRSAVRSAARRC